MTDTCSELRAALERIGAQRHAGLYISIIEAEAERADIEDSRSPTTIALHGSILSSLNTVLRSLRRSRLTSNWIRTKLQALPEIASTFIRLELMRHLDRDIDLGGEDWSRTKLRKALELAVSHVRVWFRQSPGPRAATGLAGFSRAVAVIYKKITGKSPGLGTQQGRSGYKTPFEELWHASLRLLDTDATLDQAREIYREASGRRKV